jgi:hypothetical protein
MRTSGNPAKKEREGRQMITKRGKRVRALGIFLGLALLWWISGHLWVDGSGICVGSMLECFK